MKDKDTTYLDDLFGAAKVEAPRVSVQEVEKRLTGAVVGGAAMSTLSGWKAFFSLNSILVTVGSVTLIATGGIWLTGNEEASAETTKEILQNETASLGTTKPTIHLQEESSLVENRITEVESKLIPEAPSTKEPEMQPADLELERESTPAPTPQKAIVTAPQDSKKSVDYYQSDGLQGGHANRADPNKKKAGDSPKTVIRQITELTTQEELNTLFEEFKRVGIAHEFKVKNGRNVSRRLRMTITGATQTHSIKVGRDDGWEIDFAWKESAEGKAIEFVSPIEED